MSHKHTTPNRTTYHHIHTPTERIRMHNNTWTHSYEHAKHSYLPRSSTVVMVELEPKAALKAFKPASVTLQNPVHVSQ